MTAIFRVQKAETLLAPSRDRLLDSTWGFEHGVLVVSRLVVTQEGLPRFLGFAARRKAPSVSLPAPSE